MQIGFEGLTVRASRWASIRQIETTLRENTAWIARLLAEWRALRRDVLPGEWKTGAPIVLMGRELSLSVLPARQKDISTDLINLTVLHPTPHDERALATFIVRWLKDEALRFVAPRVADCAARIAAGSPPLVSNARSEWGCNRTRSMSCGLVQLPQSSRNTSSLLRSRIFCSSNRSPRFWALVEMLYPHAAAHAGPSGGRCC
jgi:predicted metal-dependent hydrolase